MKRRKQLLAVLLAATVAVPQSMPLIPVVQAEEATTGEVVEEGLVFEKSNVTIAAGSPVNLTSEDYSDRLFQMEEGTIVVNFTSTGSSSGQTLFSIANGKSGKNNFHFHVYVQSNGTLGCEIRNGDDYNVKTGAGISFGRENTVAFVGDKTKNKYFLYANGLLVGEVDASTLSGGFRFAKNVEGTDTILLGATQRGGQPAYQFEGTIHSIQVYDKPLSREELGDSIGVPGMGSLISTMFNNSLPDNSWVFTGGEAVAGGWNQSQGARNYMGQFEEYVRFKTAGNNENGRQRYVFNTGRTGNSLTEVLADYKELVTDFSPKAVAYMVGPEDYKKGDSEEVLQQFQEDLKTFIDQSIAVKENNGGFAVVQKPYAVANQETNDIIEKYCEAIDEVVDTYEEDGQKYVRLVVVDHFTQTKSGNFKETCLTTDGFLNAQGHLEIGKQLSVAVCGGVSGYPNTNVNLNLVPTAQPEEYLKTEPQITAAETSLAVSIDEAVQEPWKYEVITEVVTVKGKADSNTFTISNLPQGEAYTLKIQSQDGKRQLVTMKGVLEKDSPAEKDSQQLDELQQKLADLMEEKESLKWLFMGDSITHAANFNYGYAGMSELFEKFLKDDLGRTQDFVLNTAVYGTTLNKTIDNVQYRLKNYAPDVVTIMLGTNDSNSTVESTGYVAKLKQMIGEIRSLKEDAVIILRTPIPTLDQDQASPNQNRLNNLPGYITAVQTVAAEENCILLDQYDNWKAELQAYPWIRTKGRDFIFGDFLHPNPRGQVMMFQKFVKACGLWTEDGYTTNLFYEMPVAQQENATRPSVRVTSDLGVRLSVENLKAVSNLSLGQVTLSVTEKETQQTYETTVELGEATVEIPTLPAGVYQAKVSGYLTNTATYVTFAKQDITISEEGYEASTKELLSTMITVAEAEVEEAYLPESWTAFTSALEDARETLAKENVTMEELEAAITTLEKATLELESKATKIQGVTISAVGTQNAASGAESALAALDGQESTFWHSNYNNGTDKTSYDNHWITFDLGKNYMISQFRYLSRPSGNNGNIKKCEISVSVDGREFVKVADGNWTGSPATWYQADFSAQEARYVKIKVSDATSGGNDKFSSASEFEMIGYEKEETETTVEVTGVTLNKATLELAVGGEETLQATVTPETASNQAVQWESSDDTIATVVDGKVTAKKAGTATITVKTEDGEKTATCVVIVTENSQGGSGNENQGDQGGNGNENEGDQGGSGNENEGDQGGSGNEKEEDAAQKELAEAKESLAQTVAGAEDKKEEDYTKESWAAYQEAFNHAKTVAEKADATKEEVEEAKAALEKAVADLTAAVPTPPTQDQPGGDQPEGEKPGGQQPGGQQPGGQQPDATVETAQKEVQTAKTQLDQVIKDAGTKLESAYTKESFTAYKNALNAAQAVLSKTNVTKEEIAAVQKTLQKAISELKAAEQAQTTPSTEKGTKFEDAKGIYQFKIKNDTEAVFTGVSKGIKTVKIANTVTYAGKTFKVTEVAAKALKGDKTVTKVTVGKNVKTIGVSAFEGCVKLTSVSLGNNTTKIGNKALKGCKALKKVTIPKKVTNLGKSVFEGCTKLSTITVKATGLTKVGKNTFKGISAKAKVKVPKKTLTKYKKLLDNKGQGKKVKIT